MRLASIIDCLPVTACTPSMSLVIVASSGTHSSPATLLLLCCYSTATLLLDCHSLRCDTIEDELSVATSKRDLRALEDFVQHYSGKILHPNHYLLLLAKRNYLFISRKNLIDLMTKCNTDEQMELKAAFKNKSELYREFWWIPEKLNCSETF